MWQMARLSVRPVSSLALVMLLIIGALTACGGAAPTATRSAGGSTAFPSVAASSVPFPAASAAPAAAASNGSSAALPTAVTGRIAPTAGTGAAASTGATAPAGGATTGQTPPQYIPIANPGRRLIKTGTVSTVVQDVDATFKDALEIARRYGGEVLQYTNTKNGDRRVADLVLQVDSAKFEEAMQALRGMAGIVERKVDKAEVKEVTAEVIDVQAQLKSLEATAAQLEELLKRTTRTDEILTIQREINNVRAQVDRLRTQNERLAEQTDLSTITLHLEAGPAAAPASPPAETAWDPGTIAGRAWYASLGILQGIGTVAITIAVFCWWLLPIALVAWLLLRRYRRATPARPAAPPPAPAAGS